MDLRKLKTLIDLVAESGISELEISEGADTVKIVNKQAHMGMNHLPHNMHNMAGMNGLPNDYYLSQQGQFNHNLQQANIAAGQFNHAGLPSVASASTDVEIFSDEERIKSPMVGTFYRAASPNTPAFVNVGDAVKVGQTLCIIEAMKLLNEIEAERDGVIKQILVDNAQPVEYGQALFIIE